MYELGTEVETRDGEFGIVTRAHKSNVAIVYDLRLDSGRERQYPYYDLRPTHNPFKIGDKVEYILDKKINGIITGFGYNKDFEFCVNFTTSNRLTLSSPLNEVQKKNNIPFIYRRRVWELIND